MCVCVCVYVFVYVCEDRSGKNKKKQIGTHPNILLVMNMDIFLLIMAPLKCTWPSVLHL